MVDYKKYILALVAIIIVAIGLVIGLPKLESAILSDDGSETKTETVTKAQITNDNTSSEDDITTQQQDVAKTTSGSQQQTPASKPSSGSQQGSTQGSQQTPQPKPQPESQATTDPNAKYYTVTFIAEKGNILVNGKVYEERYSVKVKEGTSIPNVEFPQGTRTNFGGCEWYDQKSDVSGTQFKKGTKVYSDLTVYARWTNFNAGAQFTGLGGTQYTNPVRLSNAQNNTYPCRYDIYKGAIAGVTSLNNHQELVHQTKILQRGEEDSFTGAPGKYLVVYYVQVDGELYRTQDKVITINE